MTSLEISHWIAWATVREEEAERRKLEAESEDGQVFITGLHDDEDDDPDDDGETE